MEYRTLFLSLAKFILVAVIIVAVAGLFVRSMKYFTVKPDAPIPSPSAASKMTSVEISPDKKPIAGNNGKKALSFEELKTFGYVPDFQVENVRYGGDCFGEAALSRNGGKMVFSVVHCSSDNQTKPWIGVFVFSVSADSGSLAGGKASFLIGGGGRNFVWSADDAAISYDTESDSSSFAETRTIDAQTGEILEKSGRAPGRGRRVGIL